MRDCANCGAAVDGSVCGKCGFSEGGRKGSVASPAQFLCADDYRGQRCARLGSISPSTNGSGPWYCADHLPGFRAMRGAKPSLPPGGFRGIQALIGRSLPANVDYDAAERAAIQGEHLAA